MIRSMTGYGQGTAEAPGLKVTVELRSVNNRFADLKLRLPDSLATFEPELRRKVLATIKRGRVDIDLRVERAGQADLPVRVNRPTVQAVLVAWKTLRDDYGIAGPWDLATLMRVPGVLESAGPVDALDDAGHETIARALDQALASLDAARLREGGLLAVDLIARIDRMASIVALIAARATEVPDAVRKKLVDRVEQLAAGVTLDPARLSQEVAFLADRADITEELVRLNGHLGQVRSHLATPDGEPVGKRLDFLFQEINRETNTIGSKSVDLTMSRGALDLKAEAEKIREQIQNLE